MAFVAPWQPAATQAKLMHLVHNLLQTEAARKERRFLVQQRLNVLPPNLPPQLAATLNLNPFCRAESCHCSFDLDKLNDLKSHAHAFVCSFVCFCRPFFRICLSACRAQILAKHCRLFSPHGMGVAEQADRWQAGFVLHAVLCSRPSKRAEKPVCPTSLTGLGPGRDSRTERASRHRQEKSQTSAWRKDRKS